MSDRQKDEKTIFRAAVRLKTPAERSAYIDKVCGADLALKARIVALLQAHEDKGDFLEELIEDSVIALDESPLTEGPGTKIGRYKLLQLIGEGGFGVVYMAEQERPIRRRVALKIIKLGMDTKQVIARFEAERQALAMMEHPNISRVFDAGATDTGRPYFVMELVRGIPITEYCDKNNLDTQQRLRLFIEVCRAIQHAHQKGIIHRDIKPTNVMVTPHDGKAVPKIIDFGIAKATQHRLTEKTLFTEYKRFVGTPAYMSPEQAGMSGVDVDTRSDIYSLGVLLYELLTGSTPLEAKKLRSAAYDEMCRMLRETDPPKPSTRLSTLGEMLAEVAKHRHAQPGELCKIVRGDLDWVVMKTLEKDRTRRYETANELAMDIERHLKDQPVVAGPPSAVYRLHKFVRRNRAGVMFGLLVAATLVIGLCLATLGFAQASRQRNRAEANFRMARDAVYEMTQVAEKQLPGATRARRELFERAQVFYAGFVEQNGDEPSVLEEVGMAYKHLAEVCWSLGQHKQAEQASCNAIDIFKELAHDFPNVPCYRLQIVHSQDGLAHALLSLGRHRESEQAFIQGRAIAEELVADFPEVAEYRAALAESSMYSRHSRGYPGRLEATQQALRRALELWENLAADFPDEPDYRFGVVRTRTWLLMDSDPAEQREQVFREVLGVLDKLAADFPGVREYPWDLAHSYWGLGNLLRKTNRLQEAEESLRKAVAIFENLVADFPDMPDNRWGLANTRMDLASMLDETDRLEEAEQVLRELLVFLKKLVADFPDVPGYRDSLARTWKTLGNMLRKTGRLEEAEEAFRQATELWEKLVADFPEVPEYQRSLSNVLIGLVDMLRSTGQLELWQAAYDQSEDARWELAGRFPALYPRAVYVTAFNDPASVEYRVRITSLGDYRLYVRCMGHDLGSDSLYVWVDELADGQGGSIADWYRYCTGIDADFAANSWIGSAGFERTDPGGNDTTAVWSISAPGDYTICFAVREDGVAFDAWVFQRIDLPPPEGDGPEESAMTEEMVLLESAGRVVVEAENFTSRTALACDWRIVPDEDPGDTEHRNFRGSGYLQALPDSTPESEQTTEDQEKVGPAEEK